VQVKRLLQQQPDRSGAIHAVTTPAVNLMLQLWREAYMGWIAKVLMPPLAIASDC
jgi:hypothetical protein